jgi:acyl-coenzyme A thioesterase 13
MATPASEETNAQLEHIRNVWKTQQGNSPIYDFLLTNSDLEIVAATKGSFEARLTVAAVHSNTRGTLHGAVSAAIVDWAGGLAIATHGLWKTGASVDIHVTYLSTTVIGDKLSIQGVAQKVGGSMAFTTVTITKLVDGKSGPIVASASHTKYIRPIMEGLKAAASGKA